MGNSVYKRETMGDFSDGVGILKGSKPEKKDKNYAKK